VARQANVCDGYKIKELFKYLTPRAPVGRVAVIEYARGRRAETMRWPDPGAKPGVKTSILEDDTEAKRAAELWVKEKEGKSRSGTRTWWTDGSRTDDKRVGAAEVFPNGDGCTVLGSYLGRGKCRYSKRNYGLSEWHFGSPLQKRSYCDHAES